MASVKLIYRDDKENSDGESPLYIRIIKDRKTRFISTGIKLKSMYWDDENKRVRKSYTNSTRMNAFIANKLAEAQDKALEMEIKDKNTTTKMIKQHVMGKEPVNFFTYAWNRLEADKKRLKPSTYGNYSGYLKKIETFVGSKDLCFDDIDVPFLKRYERWELNERNNTMSTIAYSCLILKKFFKEAIAEDEISYAIFPFHKYKVKAPKAERHFLNEQQFESFKKYVPEDTYGQPLVKDIFMFACYAGGLRFFDVIDLKWEHYNQDEHRISKVIRKTNRKHQLKIPKRAVEIIEKYRTKESKQSDHVFPLLSNHIDYCKEIERLYLDRNRVINSVNRILRQIGKEIKLPFSLTFHVSRHTFATRALNKGMRIEHVSKFLDHALISTTQIYAKIINEELDKAIDILDD